MPDYIIEPLDTDHEVISGRFVEFVQTYYPGWQPSDGQRNVIIARFLSMQIAFTADMASRVQRAIYRYLGASLMGILPIVGSAAVATIRFYTQVSDRTDILTYGSYVGLRDLNGDQYVFMTLADLVVEPGGTIGTTEAQSLELGTAMNGLTGTVELIEMVDWIDSAEVDGISSGGSDPEEDEIYINRLTTNFSLMAPRPIIASDFALIAQNIPGVWRAAALDNFAPGLNEKYTITSNRTGGTFKLTFNNGPLTAALPFNATAAQVKAALAALDDLDDRDLIVTGGPLNTTPIVIEFTGQYAMVNIAVMDADTSLLTGGTTFTIASTQASTMWTATAANTIAISAIDQDGNRISDTVRDELVAYLEKLRQQNFVIHYVEPTYNKVNIDYSDVSLPTALAASVESSVNDALTAYLDPASWGVPDTASRSEREWYVPLDPSTNKVRYLDLTTVVENQPGYDYTVSLTFQLNEVLPMNSADKTLSGAFPLTRMGDIGGPGVAQG